MASDLEGIHSTVRDIHALTMRALCPEFISSFGCQPCFIISGKCGVKGGWNGVWYARGNFLLPLFGFSNLNQRLVIRERTA
jgi:hypothetical protein